MVLYWGARRRYVEHLIVSLHYLAFDYLISVCYAALGLIVTWLFGAQLVWWFFFALGPVYFIYVFVMLRVVYRQSLWLTMVKILLFLGFQYGLYFVVFTAAGWLALRWF